MVSPEPLSDRTAGSGLLAHGAFWLCVVAAAGGFELLVRYRVLSPAAYAAPTETLWRLVTLFTLDGFAADVAVTARRAILGVAVGFPAGVAVALGLYTLGRARASGEMALDFVRSTPITALIPLLIVVTGIGEATKVAIGALAAALVTAVAVWGGLRDALREYSLLLHLCRPTFWKRVRLVLLPHAASSTLAALKLAVSSSLVLVVVAEMFLGGGNAGGIGKVINDRTYGDDRAAQFAAVFTAGILGYALNLAFDGFRRLVLRAVGDPRGGVTSSADA